VLAAGRVSTFDPASCGETAWCAAETAAALDAALVITGTLIVVVGDRSPPREVDDAKKSSASARTSPLSSAAERTTKGPFMG
jgi:hypothetical protein